MSCSTDTEFFIGGRVYVEFSATSDGRASAVTTAVVKVKAPDGSTTTLTLAGADVEEVKDEDNHTILGEYRAAFIPSMAGRHFWSVKTTGAVVGAEQGYFDVQRANT